jgi:hypothetical protein
MTRLFPIALVAAALAAPLQAQAPSAEATRAATAVVDIQAPPARSQAAVEAQLKELRSGASIRAMGSRDPRFKAEAAKNSPAFNAGIARMGAIQADAVGPILREMQPASRQMAIEAYARNFTVAELEAIAAFYKSPAGAKLLQRQGAINAEVQQAMAKRFGPRMQAAEKAAAPKMQAEMQKLFPQGK